MIKHKVISQYEQFNHNINWNKKLIDFDTSRGLGCFHTAPWISVYIVVVCFSGSSNTVLWLIKLPKTYCHTDSLEPGASAKVKRYCADPIGYNSWTKNRADVYMQHINCWSKHVYNHIILLYPFSPLEKMISWCLGFSLNGYQNDLKTFVLSLILCLSVC